jgi:GNAT superfamily N-acetyltransferase
MSVEVRTLARDEVARRLNDLATLRITVFREWPYLYDGEIEYEQAYLRPYTESAAAIVAGAFDGAALVGACTGTPLTDHQDGVADAVAEAGLAPRDVFYFAESVLLPAFQGRGIGHAFFDVRERHARRHAYRHVVFASVIRPDDHPMRPHRHRDLGAFWRGRGYAPIDGPAARLSWRDVGDDRETEKRLRLWQRDLAATAGETS